MTTTDPETIQRILFLSSSVHVYTIPPLTTTKGYKSSDWTTPDPRNGNKTRQIFTARIRILETSPVEEDEDTTTQASVKGKVKIDILLEDPESGELFAAAPYTDPAAVEQVLDSSRFFVVRVVSPDGRKAMLGIGFEERSAAFDFLVGLEEGRKVLGFDMEKGKESGKGGKGEEGAERDYSLKPGERIRVELGDGAGKGRVVRKEGEGEGEGGVEGGRSAEDEKALFSIAPPPPPVSSSAGASAGGRSSEDAFWIPPPPGPSGGSGSGSGRGDRRRRPQSGVIPLDAMRDKEREMEKKKQEKDLGFDDGEFGEFQ